MQGLRSSDARERSATGSSAKRDGSRVMGDCTQHELREGIFKLAGLGPLSLLVLSHLGFASYGQGCFLNRLCICPKGMFL